MLVHNFNVEFHCPGKNPKMLNYLIKIELEYSFNNRAIFRIWVDFFKFEFWEEFLGIEANIFRIFGNLKA